MPWPQRWGGRRPLIITVFVMFGLFPIVALAAGVDALRGDFELRSALLPLTIPFFVSFAGLIYVAGVRRRHRSTAPLRVSTPFESRIPGLAIPYSRSYSAWAVALILPACGSSLPVGFYASVRFSEGARESGVFAGVLAGALLVTCRGLAVEILRKRIVRGVIVLTPDGIVHHSWASDSSCSWGMVRGVQPIALPAAAIRVENALIGGATDHGFTRRSAMLRSIEAKHRPDMIIEVPSLSIDPVLMLETLRFYAACPLQRHELGTQAAIDRVRRGDVLLSGA